jgi:hypothetical protein
MVAASQRSEAAVPAAVHAAVVAAVAKSVTDMDTSGLKGQLSDLCALYPDLAQEIVKLAAQELTSAMDAKCANTADPLCLKRGDLESAVDLVYASLEPAAGNPRPRVPPSATPPKPTGEQCRRARGCFVEPPPSSTASGTRF